MEQVKSARTASGRRTGGAIVMEIKGKIVIGGKSEREGISSGIERGMRDEQDAAYLRTPPWPQEKRDREQE